MANVKLNRYLVQVKLWGFGKYKIVHAENFAISGDSRRLNFFIGEEVIASFETWHNFVKV